MDTESLVMVSPCCALAPELSVPYEQLPQRLHCSHGSSNIHAEILYAVCTSWALQKSAQPANGLLLLQQHSGLLEVLCGQPSIKEPVGKGQGC